MRIEGLDRSGRGDERSVDGCDLEKQEDNVQKLVPESGDASSERDSADKGALEVIGVVISHSNLRCEKDEKGELVSSNEGCLSRSDSDDEQCRVCHQQNEESLMDIGCHCRGELAKAHQSCIDYWFHTRGSNKCEICQQVATNVPSPSSQPRVNYLILGVDPAVAGSNFVHEDHERGSLRSFLLALILIAGLLLDVLISLFLGVSILPLNIIIGTLLLLGLGTAIRYALECRHHFRAPMVNTNINPGYHPSV